MNAILQESEATELRRLSEELTSIGSRVGHLGHTSETLVLLARTSVLLAQTVASLAARVALTENFQPPRAGNDASTAAGVGGTD
jgi:hypothetical protein